MDHAKKERALFFLILFVGIILFVWIRLEVVRLGFEHQHYLKQKKDVTDRNKQLKLEHANTLSPSKIEQYAEENMGLVEPSEKQFRYIVK